MIPDNIGKALQALGYSDVDGKIAYSGGVIKVLQGQFDDKHNDVITQDLQLGMENLGVTLDDLARFLFQLDDNLKVMSTVKQQLPVGAMDFWRQMYMGFLLEYIRFFAFKNAYVGPDELRQILKQRINSVYPSLTPEQVNGLIDGFLTVRVMGNGQYAMAVRNPEGLVEPAICPSVFIYNDHGKTRLFMTPDAIQNYVASNEVKVMEKFKTLFSLDNLPYTAGGIACIAALGVGGFLLHRRNQKKKKEQIEAIEADIVGLKAADD